MGRRANFQNPGWYVVQVNTGREDVMRAEIERVCAERDAQLPREDRVGLSECFSPKFRGRRKWKGDWQDVKRPLLPGYVIAAVRNPAALAQALTEVRGFCRLLAAEETYAPLDERERAWLDAQTKNEDRAIPLSIAYKGGCGYVEKG